MDRKEKFIQVLYVHRERPPHALRGFQKIQFLPIPSPKNKKLIIGMRRIIHSLPPSPLSKRQVTPSSSSKLMDPRPLLPRRAPALDDGHDLLGHARREHGFPAAARLALARRVKHPHERLPAALAQAERHGDLQRHAAAGCAALGADAQERRHGVQGEGYVEGWV